MRISNQGDVWISFVTPATLGCFTGNEAPCSASFPFCEVCEFLTAVKGILGLVIDFQVLSFCASHVTMVNARVFRGKPWDPKRLADEPLVWFHDSVESATGIPLHLTWRCSLTAGSLQRGISGSSGNWTFRILFNPTSVRYNSVGTFFSWHFSVAKRDVFFCTMSVSFACVTGFHLWPVSKVCVTFLCDVGRALMRSTKVQK